MGSILKAERAVYERKVLKWVRSTSRAPPSPFSAQCRASWEGEWVRWPATVLELTAQIFLPRVKRKEIICKKKTKTKTKTTLPFLSFVLKNFIYGKVSIYCVVKAVMKHNAFYPQSEALERWDDGNFISSLIFESLFHLKKILFFFLLCKH